MAYRIFTRTWWKPNRAWPNGREPGAGRKSYGKHPVVQTIEEARAYCKRWNETHDPGPLSRKAEFEET